MLLAGAIPGEAYYVDVDTYIRFPASSASLTGADNLLGFQFRFCNDRGMLIYQEGGDNFFALGVNSGKIYIEWKTSNKVVEVGFGFVHFVELSKLEVFHWNSQIKCEYLFVYFFLFKDCFTTI